MGDGTEMTTPANGNPTSWRDVYSLVQDVEKRLTDRMGDIAEAAKAASSDHEIRLRVLEKADSTRSGGDRRAGTLDTTARGWIGVALGLAAGIMSVVAMTR